MAACGDVVACRQNIFAKKPVGTEGVMEYDNANYIIGLKNDEYVPPKIPIALPHFDEKTFTFGAEAKKHFLIDFKNWTFLNHGAFGGVLKESLDIARDWQIYIEKQPLRFVDRELLTHMVYITRRLAGFLCCDPRDLVLVPNATEGINTVIRSLKLCKGDKVFYLNTCYYAVKKLLRHLSAEDGVEIQEATIPFPSYEDDILSLVETTLQPGTKLAVFSHIPSVIPIIMPISRLIGICHKRDVPVLVDGAHALGALPLRIAELGADYYVANAHKWLCAPKGCAALYVADKHKGSVRCLTVSGGFGRGFTTEFLFRGLRDYSPYLALHTVLDFWETVSPDRIYNHNTSLAHKAATLLAKCWDTDTLFPLYMFGPMVLVRLPDLLWQCQVANGNDEVDKPKAEAVQERLHCESALEVPVKAVNGKLYVRISAHVYNELNEYKLLADAVLRLVELCKDNSS
ncbi:predicted protein [Nematostella vectensis]|uniref:Aminotransferase class V domain-containing protein n=1 Tax=Nematostella vectensis TaxID=45351 RepID=A7S5A5_NEMVE|nr:L-cysteine desulfhydrase [Nematostella vectensis]EDO41055.1 predicted protein [Nematostella vectensis]|eukprot:XP_001633118.1 predicted protein [Nematostella vectensis]